jgi:hypothetical protein
MEVELGRLKRETVDFAAEMCRCRSLSLKNVIRSGRY